MDAQSTYTIKFHGEKEDITKVLPIIQETLECEISGVPEEIEIEEECILVWVDDITEELAVNMARCAPNLAFTIEGNVEVNESGEFMDFLISYADKKITEASSGWYIMVFAGDYGEYEEFCDEYYDEEGAPICSEEEFEEFKTIEPVFILDSDCSKILTSVPLDDIREIKI